MLENATHHSEAGRCFSSHSVVLSFFLDVSSSWCNILVLFFATNKPIMDSPIQLGLNATSYTPPYTPPSSVQSGEHPYNVLGPPRLSGVSFVLAIRLVVFVLTKQCVLDLK
jgi:hypothetical protein